MIFQISSYLKHFYRAKDLSKIEDVKLRSLLEDVLDDEKRYYSFLTLGMLRKKMLRDTRQIDVLDLGAGSKKLSSSKRQIKDIAKLSVKKAKYAEVLFRLIEKMNIEVTIEMGTSLGITSGYLAHANKKGKVITLEGCSETLKIAQDNFTELALKNVKIVAGNFDDTFLNVLKENPNVGLVFIDGNHTKEATLRYFNMVKDLGNQDVILVFDDIHWSSGMEEAWMEIKKDAQVTVSVDLFEMGIVFFSEYSKKGDYFIVV